MFEQAMNVFLICAAAVGGVVVGFGAPVLLGCLLAEWHDRCFPGK